MFYKVLGVISNKTRPSRRSRRTFWFFSLFGRDTAGYAEVLKDTQQRSKNTTGMYMMKIEAHICHITQYWYTAL